jgi:hypothetical protein
MVSEFFASPDEDEVDCTLKPASEGPLVGAAVGGYAMLAGERYDNTTSWIWAVELAPRAIEAFLTLLLKLPLSMAATNRVVRRLNRPDALRAKSGKSLVFTEVVVDTWSVWLLLSTRRRLLRMLSVVEMFVIATLDTLTSMD